ncbi:uncharacterized protein LOC129808867 [Phlebotomus papatasi]|uniref:uncharacterized protein LOC129808867 n=1 Tax=Phlebotomus papatasi TaxID=29031 RepID=UPI0024838253|nr:uncharacterized protein LOC129808867 [Phlebotomus papatasi]
MTGGSNNASPYNYEENISQLADSETDENLIATPVIPEDIRTIFSEDNNVILCHLGSNQPNWQVRPSDIVIPQRFKLADPQWHVTRPIDILIGAQLFWDIVGGETYSLGSGLPCLRDTKLGWIIIGSFGHNQDQANSFTVSCNVSNATRIDETFRKFWDIESIPMETMVEKEHREVENLFSATTSRAEDGRCVVHLHFNERLSDLGNNSRSAFRQFHSLESKLNKDPELKVKYAQIFEEYLKLNIIEPVPCDELYNSSFYLPHHCVVRAEAETTKVRVVFNASSRSETGVSLNDCLMIGPVVQPPLISVLMRFRMYPWAISTDIVKMYLQSVHHYRFRTVCCGVASSPHLASRVLKQLDHDEGNSFPLAAKVITSNFYVDDCLLSVKTPQEAKEVMRQLIELMNSAGMTLSKTKSNIGNFKHAGDVSEVPLNDD